MIPDSDSTQVIGAGRAATQGGEHGGGITLSPDLPSRLDAAITVQDARRTASDATEPRVDAARVRYAILGEAGRGGMATVHVARDLELMRNVALKQLADDLRGAGQARLRFLREVQVTAQLDHPYIVPVYGLEVAPGGAPAYAMKLVAGRTFADYLQETIDACEAGREPDEAHSLPARIEHLLKVCEAVHYAHGKGVIHRDLKPANIMLGAHGETYVMDWGICRLFGGDDPDLAMDAVLSETGAGAQTEYGAVVGTPRYMSPEQAQGRSHELGPRSDQCALGLMLFELVTLSAPFEGDSPLEVMQNAAHGRRAALRHAYERRPIAAPLRAIIERATRYEPEQRYGSVRELADDLRRYLHGEAVHALPDTSWQRAQRFVGRHRQGILLSLLGLVALTAIGFTALMWRHEQLADAARAREALERDLIEHVVQAGDRLQLELLGIQSESEALALAATQLLQFGTPDASANTHWDEDYLTAATRPADYAMQPQLGRPVSLEWAVWSIADGLDRSELEPQALRLHHLRGYRNALLDMTRRSLGGGQFASGVIEMKLVLESGLFMRYPGRALETNPDLRDSAWYRAVAPMQSSTWGTPYADDDGDHVVLPLVSPLRAADGDFLGALSMDLALDFVVHNLLREDDGHDLILLDAEGRVLASEALLRMGAGEAGQIVLRPFGDTALRAAFAVEDVGAVATRARGRPDIVAFDRIHPLGWILVLVAADPDRAS